MAMEWPVGKSTASINIAGTPPFGVSARRAKEAQNG
jgi:hypothetical protein